MNRSDCHLFDWVGSGHGQGPSEPLENDFLGGMASGVRGGSPAKKLGFWTKNAPFSKAFWGRLSCRVDKRCLQRYTCFINHFIIMCLMLIQLNPKGMLYGPLNYYNVHTHTHTHEGQINVKILAEIQSPGQLSYSSSHSHRERQALSTSGRRTFRLD